MSDPIAHYDSILNTALRRWVSEEVLRDAVPRIREALFANGCGAFNSAYAAATSGPYDLAAAEAARKRAKDGELEVDDFPIVSRSESGGAYVMAWLWIPDDEIDCDEESSDG